MFKQTLNLCNKLFNKKLATLAVCSALSLSACGNAETASSKAASTTKASTKTAIQAPHADVVKSLTANLKASGIEGTIDSVQPTAMQGVYWVTSKDLPSFFTDAKGEFVIEGNIIQIGKKNPVDISAQIREKDAAKLLAKLDTKDMVIFKADGETKSVLYVFTDVDCGYCRKMHSEIEDINKQGIEVRYIAWPRSPQTMPSMESIWCAKDPVQAMTTVKSGGNIEPATCDNPIKEQVDLGFKLGITGTPSVFTQDGRKIGGYIPSKHIAEAINQK